MQKDLPLGRRDQISFGYCNKVRAPKHRTCFLWRCHTRKTVDDAHCRDFPDMRRTPAAQSGTFCDQKIQVLGTPPFKNFRNGICEVMVWADVSGNIFDIWNSTGTVKLVILAGNTVQLHHACADSLFHKHFCCF